MRTRALTYSLLSLISLACSSLVYTVLLRRRIQGVSLAILLISFAMGKALSLLFHQRKSVIAAGVAVKPDPLSVLKLTLSGTAFWIFFLFLAGAGEGMKLLFLLEGPFFLFFTAVYLSISQKGVLTGENRGKRVLIIGAGDSGARLIREIESKPELRLHVVGLADDNPNLSNLSIRGVPVIGKHRDIPLLTEKHRIEKILIAIPSASERQMKAIVRKCIQSGVHYQTVPTEDELINDEVNLGVVRDVSLEDLLSRKAVEIEGAEIEKTLRGRRVMITGAGGSIGSEICRQALGFMPECLILFERNEANLYDLERRLKRDFPPIPLMPVIGDVTDGEEAEKAFKVYRPSLVYHSAAYKHVPMMERNVCQAVKNNVMGTRNLLLLSEKYHVEHFVNISTDKVVNPTNVMGISKRVAELMVRKFSEKGGTRFMTVRFGNVLGSRGSVIPLFQEQIRKGGPVTVTHPDVTRYFMTMKEAAQLVMLAGAIGKGGETFVLEMGKPVKILNLARSLIALSGREDVPIRFTGLRPGEKLMEELWAQGEKKKPTACENILLADSIDLPLDGNLDFLVRKLIRSVQEQREREAVSLLLHIVPEARLNQGKSPAPFRPVSSGNPNMIFMF